jgi:hypothetical protein
MTFYIYSQDEKNPAAFIKQKISLVLLNNDSSVKAYDIDAYDFNYDNVEFSDYINLLAFCLRCELDVHAFSIIHVDSANDIGEYSDAFKGAGKNYLGLLNKDPEKSVLINRVKHLQEFQEILHFECSISSAIENAISNSPNIKFSRNEINKLKNINSKYLRSIKKLSGDRLRYFTGNARKLKRLLEID